MPSATYSRTRSGGGGGGIFDARRCDLRLEAAVANRQAEGREPWHAHLAALLSVIGNAARLVAVNGSVGATLLEQDPKAVDDLARALLGAVPAWERLLEHLLSNHSRLVQALDLLAQRGLPKRPVGAASRLVVARRVSGLDGEDRARGDAAEGRFERALAEGINEGGRAERAGKVLEEVRRQPRERRGRVDAERERLVR